MRTITVQYGGKKWTRYPDSDRRTHRVYYQRHEKWKDAPVFLHRRIYEDNFGPIPKGWHIHHKDGNTENNSPENLEALSPSEHSKLTVREFKADKERFERSFSRRRTKEWSEKMSLAQKNRRETAAVCDLCKESFLTKCHADNVRWCPKCKEMLYSDKNGQHFSKKKQIERFGEVKVPYSQPI